MTTKRHLNYRLLVSFWALCIWAAGGVARAQGTPYDVASALANGQATVTHTAFDNGSIGSVFDGSTNSLARTPAINPLVVTITFSSPKQFVRSRTWFLAGDNRWRVETADTLADMDAATGSFKVALDWATGPESAWQDRSFPAPVTCRVVRLKLERLAGDNYVHLNEWQLYTAERLYEVTDLRQIGNELQLTWNSVPNQWYEVQSSTNLTTWTGAGLVKASDETFVQRVPMPAGDRGFYRVRKALPEERTTITKRVLVINLDPILEAHGGKRLSSHLAWNDPRTLNAAYLRDLSDASGGYVQWQLSAWVDLDLWPRKLDGFQYSDTTYLQSVTNSQQYPWHTPDAVDYEVLLDLPLPGTDSRSAHQRVVAGEVDEVIFWGGPYFGFYESRMVGSSAYWCNAPPLIRNSRLYVVMGLNYERGVAEALHSFGHRCESILTRVYRSWSSTSTINHLWDRFTRIGPVHQVAVAGVGNVHFPPNAADGYAYSVATPVNSEADRWLSYPTLSGGTSSVSVASWGGSDHQRTFLLWWMNRFPKTGGRYTDATNSTNHGKLNNWWAYLVDMNEYGESR